MITSISQTYEFRGLSTDDKSKIVKPGNGSVFREIDTGKFYMYNAQGNSWVEFTPGGGGGGGGASSMSDLDDVSLENLEAGQVLKWDEQEQKWVNADDTAATEIGNLSDVSIDNPTDGQVLKYDASTDKWINDDIAEGYDEEAHTVHISNFNSSDISTAVITLDVEKFLNGGRYLNTVKITKTGDTAPTKIIEPIYSKCEQTEETTYPIPLVIPANTTLTFKDTLSFTGITFDDSSIDMKFISNSSNQTKILFHNDSFYGDGMYYSSASYRAYRVSNNHWEITDYKTLNVTKEYTETNNTYRNFLINNIRSGLPKVPLNVYIVTAYIGIVLNGKNKYYKIKITINLDTNTYSYTLENTDIAFEIPVASSADGTYVLNATVTSGTPTYSWENEIDTLSELEDVDLTNIADGQMLVYDATNQKWINTSVPEGYDEEAHTIYLSNFDPTNLANTTVSLNAEKFIKRGQYIDKIEIKKPNDPADVTSVLSYPDFGILNTIITYPTYYVSQAFDVLFNQTLKEEYVGKSYNVTFNLSQNPWNYNCTTIQIMTQSKIKGSYYGGSYEMPLGIPDTSRRFNIKSGQTLSSDFVDFLINNTDFSTAVNYDNKNLKVYFEYKDNYSDITNQKYIITVAITKNNNVWSASGTCSEYIPENPVMPNAPTTDGTYALQATVTSGSPTYSWETQVTYSGGDGIDITSNVVKIDTANASANDILSFSGQNTAWISPLTSAEITEIVNGLI